MCSWWVPSPCSTRRHQTHQVPSTPIAYCWLGCSQPRAIHYHPVRRKRETAVHCVHSIGNCCTMTHTQRSPLIITINKVYFEDRHCSQHSEGGKAYSLYRDSSGSQLEVCWLSGEWNQSKSVWNYYSWLTKNFPASAFSITSTDVPWNCKWINNLYALPIEML